MREGSSKRRSSLDSRTAWKETTSATAPEGRASSNWVGAMLGHYVHLAVRNIPRAGPFVFMSIVGLALGLATARTTRSMSPLRDRARHELPARRKQRDLQHRGSLLLHGRRHRARQRVPPQL